jgi:sulfite reductase beta subunit-like hemoprotein
MTDYAELAEIDQFASTIAAWRAGALGDDDFRAKRLHMGCYGIRQSDTHMIRVKVPGGELEPRHLDAMADIADAYSRGFAHLTTRQNFQVHFVELDDVPDLMRRAAADGLTTREACGNSVRTVTQSHLAGIDPTEVVDTRPAMAAFTRYFLRHPAFQNLPRKFKMALDGSDADLAQIGIHDVGLLGVRDADGNGGFKVFVGGGLGSAPREADLFEEFTPPELLLPTVEAILTIFNDNGERKNRVRARMKFLLTRWGIERFRAEVLALREQLLVEKDYPQVRVPVATHTRHDVALPDAPAGLSGADAQAFTAWRDANAFAHDADDGTARFAAYVTFHLGDVTSEQLRALGKVWRELGGEVTVRTSIRQNLVFTHLDAAGLHSLHATLAAGGMDLARAEKSGDVVSCPGAETCNLAITSSRGLADAVTDALTDAGLHEVEGLRVNISGCPNACGQHTSADLGFAGMARRDPKGNEAPGYRVYVGAAIDAGGIKFGHYVTKVPARKAPEVAVELVGRYAVERELGERFSDWVARVGADTLKAELKPFDSMPALEEDPLFYTDFGMSRQFEVILGKGECA